MLFDSQLFFLRAISRSLPSKRGFRPRSTRRKSSPASATIEQLEDRTLLSAADLLEPNDTLGTATDLGTVSGHGEINNVTLSIHESGDEDWLRFDLSAPTGPGHYIAIEFDHSQGDLDLELFDTNGVFFAESAGVGDSEEIGVAGLAAGEWYLRVFGYNGAINPDYNVRYNAPTGAGDFLEPNDSIDESFSLGELEGFSYWDEFSIHESGNDDWFEFELVEEADSIHFASISFDHDDGDLDIALYNADGEELDYSASTDDFETIWLDDLPSGTYFLEVYGFAGAENPDFSLTIEAPHEADHENGTFSPDLAESNDTLETAHDLGLLTGFQELGPLSIHEPGDEDWFRFETAATSTTWDGATIAFWNEEGDLDLELFDAEGGLIQAAGGIGNLERVELVGLAGDEYFLRVSGFANATNPDYWLTVNAPEALAADFAEPNNVIEEAYDLRAVEELEMLDGLSIDVPGDVDWFRFETLDMATHWHNVSIGFFDELGDLDLAVYDAGGEMIESSESVDDQEFVSLAGLPAGEYYAAVWGFADATNPEYQLAIVAPQEPVSGGDADFAEPNDTSQTAYDLRTIEHDSSWDGLSIHVPGNEDWFSFTTIASGSASDAVSIEFDHELGDLDMSLYNAQGTLLASSASIWNFEHISLESMPAGTYRIQVLGYDGAVHPDYALAITAPRALEPDHAEENDTRETAFELRDVSEFVSWDGFSIHDANDQDWFSFDLVGEASWAHAVGIDFYHAAGDLDLSIYDANGILRDSSSGIDNGEEISLHGFAEGTYFLQVIGYEGSTVSDYGVWIEAPHENQGIGEFQPDWAEVNDTLLEATPLRVIEGFDSWNNLSIHSVSDSDWFEFSLLSEATVHHYAGIDFFQQEGDLDLALFDPSGTLLAESTGVSDGEEISLAGWPAGGYLLQVTGYDGATNPGYTLAIAAPDYQEQHGEENLPPDAHEPNNAKDDAIDLRTIEGQTVLEDLSIHSSADSDWFRFNTTMAGTAGHAVRIAFEHDLGDLDIVLHDTAGEIGHSDSVGDAEEISLAGLPPATYWIEIFGYSGQTNPEFTLTFETPVQTTPEPDRYESNDTLETAVLVRSDATSGTLAGSETLADLSIHSSTDVDLFRFTTVATATSAHGLSIGYRNGDGDLVLEILADDGTVIETVTGADGYAAVSLDSLEAGTWIARVSGFDEATNVYDLVFDTPPVENEPGTPGADAWTVMVYITASNLESFAFSDINEMEAAAASLPGSVNLAVLWDQSAAGQTFASGGGAQSAWGTTGRAFVSADTNSQVVATEFELLGEQNTGDPATLGAFIDWSSIEAPADHYALILWDHGSGLQGFNYDDSDGGSSDNMTTAELVSVLEAPGRPYIDVIAFDACLMAMTEVGHSLSGLTDVFVASQEVVGADGHDYTTLFEPLEQAPETINAQALATGFVSSYEDQYAGDFWGWDTQSAIATDGYEPLLSALAGFVDAAIAGTDDDMQVLRDARSDAITYDISFLRDLGSFINAVAENNETSPLLRDAADTVETAIDGMVLARSEDSRDSVGLSVFLPDNATTAGSWYTTPYSNFDSTTGWSNLITAMGGGSTSSSSNSGGRSITGPDWSEQNDVMATARDLNTLVGSGHTFNSLNLHNTTDIDWFRLTISATGSSSDSITVTPNGDAAEVLQLVLFDSTGVSTLDSSNNGPGPQQVSLDGLAAGNYLIRIDSPPATAVSGYDLTIDAPDGDATDDWAGDNSTQPKAFHLGTIGANTVFSGLGVAGGSDDWFTFDTPRRVGAARFTLDLSTPQGQPVSFELRDSGDNLLDQANGDGLLSLTYLASGSGERLTLRVAGGTTASAYSLHFAPSTATVAVDLDNDGNLVITDTSEFGQDDDVRIRTENGMVIIDTPGHVLAATVGTSDGPHSVEVPLGTVSGEIRVVAGDGHDRVDASGTDHPLRLFGQSGKDTLTGGAAGDILNGGGADDLLVGGGGSDRLYGGGGRDTLRGGEQADFLVGQGGEDELRGGADDDTLKGGTANDRLFGDAGHDRINGDDGHDLLNGSSGNDTAYGGNGNDVLRGGGGRDWLIGGAGGDRQFGQGNTDTLQGSAGNDLLDGGSSSDEIYEVGDVSFVLTATSLSGQGNDTLISIERGRLTGGAGNNTLDAFAFPGSVVLYGGDGNDLLRGGPASDRLVAGFGDDSLEGHGGNDRLFGGYGRDRIEGGQGNDFLRGQFDDDLIIGGHGQDTLNGERGDDTLSGGPGNDMIRGGSGADRANGDEGTDTVYGQSGDDRLCGTDNDIVVGQPEEIDQCVFAFDEWADDLG